MNTLQKLLLRVVFLAAILPMVASAVAPVAYNQSASVVEAVEALITLTWSDVDTPAVTNQSFMVTSNPRGSLESYASRSGGDLRYPNFFYYRAPVGPGSDSFTWKCNDGSNDSNVGTCSITVMTNTKPVAENSYTCRDEEKMEMFTNQEDAKAIINCEIPQRKSHFHLFLLGGPSNMAGRGREEAQSQDKEIHTRIWMMGNDRMNVVQSGKGVTHNTSAEEAQWLVIS